jgi:vancomycin permeability regulator SanA
MRTSHPAGMVCSTPSAGRRTYDTCYRADYIFGVEEAVLVTQWFHLDRALYTCDKPGIDAVGVAADRRTTTWRATGGCARCLCGQR